jgi:hypothetical protein
MVGRQKQNFDAGRYLEFAASFSVTLIMNERSKRYRA